MQSFMPFRSHVESASVLDSLRLNKQRVECFQIYNAIIGHRYRTNGEYVGPAKGWTHHPAVLMWKKYPHQFLIYSLAICAECNQRGIADNSGIEQFFWSRLSRHEDIVPHWMLDEKVLEKINFTHRCNLVRKDMPFYRPKFPDVNVVNALMTDYFWPRS